MLVILNNNLFTLSKCLLSYSLWIQWQEQLKWKLIVLQIEIFTFCTFMYMYLRMLAPISDLLQQTGIDIFSLYRKNLLVTSLPHHSIEIVKEVFHHKLTDFFFFFWESKIFDLYGRTALARNECSHKRFVVNINTVVSGEGAKNYTVILISCLDYCQSFAKCKYLPHLAQIILQITQEQSGQQQPVSYKNGACVFQATPRAILGKKSLWRRCSGPWRCSARGPECHRTMMCPSHLSVTSENRGEHQWDQKSRERFVLKHSNCLVSFAH